MTKRRKIAVSAALTVLIVAAGVWRWRAGSRSAAPSLETAVVDRGRIVAKVTATGTLSALVTVQVGSQVSGRIASIDVDFNSPVKKGQIIARIDPQLFEASVEQARANAVAAQGNLTKAKAQALDAQRQLERARALAERNLVAKADLDTAQATADAAKASVEAAEGTVAQAKAGLNQAQVNLAYTKIVSPTNGVVISRNVDVGQTVAASLQAPTLFVIAEDLAKMQVDTSVAEADVGRLTAGMAASFTVDAFPGEVFQGTVRQVRNAPQTVQNVVTYDAVIDVANPELKLKPGMTATATFVYAQKDDVLRVPNAALRFRPPPGFGGKGGSSPRSAGGLGGRAQAAETAGPAPGAAPAQAGQRRPTSGEGRGRTVWVVRGERPEPVRIVPGISDGSVTEIVSGDLQEGDRVVTDAAGPSGGAQQGLPGGGMRRGPF
jgi:HlyD family secretion protein